MALYPPTHPSDNLVYLEIYIGFIYIIYYIKTIIIFY